MDISFIRPMLTNITFPKMDLFDGFDLEPSEIKSWLENPENRYRVFTEEFLDSISEIPKIHNEDDSGENFDAHKAFETNSDALNLIGLCRKLEKHIELVYKNQVFNTYSHQQQENARFLLDLNGQQAMQLGLDFGRVEGCLLAYKSIFASHTVLTQKFSEKELLAMSSSAVGSRKNLKRRTKAIKWIEQNLNANPELSINALAKELHNKSTKKLDGFERTIPLSTAKDWIRKVKNGRQTG